MQSYTIIYLYFFRKCQSGYTHTCTGNKKKFDSGRVLVDSTAQAKFGQDFSRFFWQKNKKKILGRGRVLVGVGPGRVLGRASVDSQQIGIVFFFRN